MDPRQRSQDPAQRAKKQGRLRVADQRPKIEDPGSCGERAKKQGRLRTADQGQWMESKPWMKTFYKLGYCGQQRWHSERGLASRHCALSEFVACSHLALRVFLRVLQFPSLLKNQHFQILIQIGFLFIIVDKHLPVLYISLFKCNFKQIGDTLFWTNRGNQGKHLFAVLYQYSLFICQLYMCTKCYRFHSPLQLLLFLI